MALDATNFHPSKMNRSDEGLYTAELNALSPCTSDKLNHENEAYTGRDDISDRDRKIKED